MQTILLALFFVAAPLYTHTAHAKDCLWTVDRDSIRVSWEAYKTPAKLGVKGLLKHIELKGPQSAKSMNALLEGITFTIHTGAKSLSTANPSRDATIAKSFFSTLKNNGLISGHFSKVEQKNLMANLTINGVHKALPLSYTLKEGQLVAQGFIDVLDFAMGPQLTALTKACLKKHQGKTWSDVAIELRATLKKACK